MKLHFFLILLLFLMFASVFPLQKHNLNYSEPCFLIGFRMVLAGFILFIYIFFNKKLFKKISKCHIKYFIFLSIFNIYLTNFFELLGLNATSSSKTCLIYSLSPFITIILSYILLKEKLTKKKILGLSIGIIGLIPLLLFKTAEENYNKNIFIFSISEIYLIISVFFSVLGWILLKIIVNLGYSFILANSISMIIGGIFILISSVFIGETWNPIPVSNFKYFIFYTFITCLISNFLCYNLFGYLLTRFSITFMTFSGLTTPFFAIFFGWFFLNEIVTGYFFLSIFLFFIGLAIFYKEEFT